LKYKIRASLRTPFDLLLLEKDRDEVVKGKVFAKGMWESMPLADTHRDAHKVVERVECKMT